MNGIFEADMVVVLLTTLVILASSRFVHCIRLVAFQGMAMSLLPIFSPHPAWWFTLGAFIIKGVLLPWLLYRARQQANVVRETNPPIGFGASLFGGLLMLAASFWLAAHLPLPHTDAPPLIVSIAFFNLFSGLFLIIGRRSALAQVLGYLVMENGIYAFGMMYYNQQSLLVEMGVLLDLIVAVFVMTLMIFHISREFEHIDVDRLNTLKG